MNSRYSIFCVILGLIVMGLGFENYDIWSQSATTVIKREVPKKPESKGETVPATLGPKEGLPREGYKVIAEKNIFNPERKEFPAIAGDDASKRPNVRPQVTLYGVVMAGDYLSATVINPGRPLQKGEREARTVKIGDRIGDYKVAKILEDRIVMENAGDTFEVLLYDPSAPKRRMEVKTAVPPVAVTSATGGPTPSPTPGAVPGPSPATPASSAGLPRPSPMSPSPAPSLGISSPQAMPPPMPSAPGQPSPGVSMPSSGVQPPSSTTDPSPGIWRGRRPIQPGTQTGTQGN
jgi:hypothetical protein